MSKSFFIFHLLVFAFFFIGITLFILSCLTFDVRKGLDIRAFYTAAVMVEKGNGKELYVLPKQYAVQNSIFSIPKQDFIPFINPPFVALVFLPLALFSVEKAHILTAVINSGIFLLCIFLLLKRKESDAMYFILLFLYIPLWLAILSGQTSFFLLLSILASWQFFRKNKPEFAGIALSLLLIKPNLLFFPLVLLIWKKQWKALWGFLWMTLGLGVLSWLVVGVKGMNDYLHLLFLLPTVGDFYGIHPQNEPTLKGFLQILFHTNIVSPLIFPFTFGICLVGLLWYMSWKGKWDTTINRFDEQYAVLVVAMLLTSLHTNYHDLLLLLFPWVVLLRQLRQSLIRYIVSIGILFFLLIFAWIPGYFAPLLVLLLGVSTYQLTKGNLFRYL